MEEQFHREEEAVIVNNNDTPLPPPPSMNSVEDLERKLAMLGSEKNKKTETTTVAEKPAAVLPIAAAAVAAVAAPSAIKGGKNALLARIMAAKEKQEKKKALPTPASPSDLLTDFDAPSTEKDPPPSYGTNFLTDAPPPAFDVIEQQEQFPPPPPIDSILPPPPPLNEVLPPPPLEQNFLAVTPSAPAATAPMFEDLIGGQQQQQHHPPAMPPPLKVTEPAALDIDESILNALEPAEREAFLEEQRKIMEQIEIEKSNNKASDAAVRAMAFDQRSSNAVANVAASYESRGNRTGSRRSNPSRTVSATINNGPTTVDLGGGTGEVAVHGSEKTQQAIEDGTAVIVKCMSCDNWMQVTEAAELMFCPICQVVCPVEKKGAATTADMDAAAQLAADSELAEKLQKEEYTGAEERRSRRRNTTRQQQQLQQQESEGQTWYDWLTGAPATAAPATRSSPSAGNVATSSTRSFISAQTGEEPRSYNETTNNSGARVAEQKSVFSCVADSINTAATQMTAYNLGVDEEGNVHGVNSEGLLAMPDVSRQREN